MTDVHSAYKSSPFYAALMAIAFTAKLCLTLRATYFLCPLLEAKALVANDAQSGFTIGGWLPARCFAIISALAFQLAFMAANLLNSTGRREAFPAHGADFLFVLFLH